MRKTYYVQLGSWITATDNLVKSSGFTTWKKFFFYLFTVEMVSRHGFHNLSVYLFNLISQKEVRVQILHHGAVNLP